MESTLTKQELNSINNMLNVGRKEIAKVFVGQDEVVDKILITLLVDKHSLLEGVPGLAKSLLVEALGKIVEGTTHTRIQFVPDLLPADLMGVHAYNPKNGEFYVVKGPVFANFLLADEINRAPPKTQAAMLEVMQEKKVSIGKDEFKLDEPFFVLATENPLEQQGTYPLPEALVDRFFMKILLDYPKREEELQIMEQNSMKQNLLVKVEKVWTKEFILSAQDAVKKIYVSQQIREYVMDIVQTTRKLSPITFDEQKYIRCGAGPRASILLVYGAQAHALLQGRDFVIPDDIKAVIYDLLRHRLILSYEAKADGVSSEMIIDKILKEVNI